MTKRKIMFLPTTQEELKALGWQKLDIIIITGDTYIDSYYSGAALIGKFLFHHGYKVGIIAQPDVNSKIDVSRLGEPALFWGVTSGAVDSMVANYTALKKRRKSDDMTPGGINNLRPDRAVIVYTNLIKKYFKNTSPIVIGGIEASLRRIAHYDYWDNAIRRSILFDAKADILVYGMAEITALSLAKKLKKGTNYKNIEGICYIDKYPKKKYIDLPSFKEIQQSNNSFIEMFNMFYHEQDPESSKGLNQKYNDQYLICNPPMKRISQETFHEIYGLHFERDVHPYYKRNGIVKALDTIKFSVTSHRGCYGECNFCAIAIHQGRYVQSRSEKSIIKEIESFKKFNNFKGIVSDLGGPTANMYLSTCNIMETKGPCKLKRCVYPEKCSNLKLHYDGQVELLEKVKNLPHVKKVFISSGIRYDLIDLSDNSSNNYIRAIIQEHISGQMKIAPEHVNIKVLSLMGKPGNQKLISFLDKFEEVCKAESKELYMTYYFIAAYPGTTIKEMEEARDFVLTSLKVKPEQVQIFTPTPSTYASLMYYTQIDPFSGEKLFIEKSDNGKQAQKNILTN